MDANRIDKATQGRLRIRLNLRLQRGGRRSSALWQKSTPQVLVQTENHFRRALFVIIENAPDGESKSTGLGGRQRMHEGDLKGGTFP